MEVYDVSSSIAERYREYYHDMFIKTSKMERYRPGETLITLDDGSKYIFDVAVNARGTIRKYFSRNDDVDDVEKTKMFSYGLKRQMVMKHINQQQLAELTGTSQCSINKYVNGKAIPNIFVADKIAKALECSIDDLIY